MMRAARSRENVSANEPSSRSGLGDDAGGAEPRERVGKRTNRLLVFKKSQTARFAHVVERFQRAPEVGVRMPPGCDTVDRVLLKSMLSDDAIPHRPGVAHLFDERRRVARIFGRLEF